MTEWFAYVHFDIGQKCTIIVHDEHTAMLSWKVLVQTQLTITPQNLRLNYISYGNMLVCYAYQSVLLDKLEQSTVNSLNRMVCYG
jgi:hypothetical protein